MAGYQPARGYARADQDVSSFYKQASGSSADDLTELRRQQAAFQAERTRFDDKYGWMSAPALAPEFALMGAEGVAALLARKGLPKAYQALNFLYREPNLRNGNTWATMVGRRVHKLYEAAAERKPGWEPEPGFMIDGKRLKPDLGSPQRSLPDPKRYLLDVKPDTPTGRIAGAKAIKKYSQTRNKVRIIYYNPKDYM